MYIYEEAMARYAGAHVDAEIESAMVRVQDKHHTQLVNDVMNLLHEELIVARLEKDPELMAIFAEARDRSAGTSE